VTPEIASRDRAVTTVTEGSKGGTGVVGLKGCGGDAIGAALGGDRRGREPTKENGREKKRWVRP